MHLRGGRLVIFTSLKRLPKTLSSLPESERTVVTLYYLGKMTTKEISKFLGVSVNTITSRLQRARKRLQEQQEALIQEVLAGVRKFPDASSNAYHLVGKNGAKTGNTLAVEPQGKLTTTWSQLKQ